MDNELETPTVTVETTTAATDQTGTPAEEIVSQTPHDLAETNETRRGKHNEWLLVGLYRGTPIWSHDWTMKDLNAKYSGAKLRSLRKERGHGSKKARAKLQTALAYVESFKE